MRLINPSVELITQESGLEGIYKHTEKVARTCYKSENHITEDSAKPFVERLIKSKHLAMLEHATVYLKIPIVNNYRIANSYCNNPYTVVYSDETYYYVTTNYRVIVEHDWLDDLDFLCEPTEHHYKRLTLKFITSIGVSREGNRTRKFSIAEQSTRYCNYTKDKFGGELTFVKPAWLDIPTGQYQYWDGDWCDVDKMKIQLPEGKHEDIDAFLWHLNDAELHYTMLINSSWKPQQAREVLPLSLATEVVYTAFEEDWKHFMDLRYRGTTGAPHPNMLQVATMAHDLIKDKLGKDL